MMAFIQSFLHFVLVSGVANTGKGSWNETGCHHKQLMCIPVLGAHRI